MNDFNWNFFVLLNEVDISNIEETSINSLLDTDLTTYSDESTSTV